MESFLTERVKISVLTSSSNYSQEGHPGPNASLDGWHVLCFVVPGYFLTLYIFQFEIASLLFSLQLMFGMWLIFGYYIYLEVPKKTGFALSYTPI